MCKLNTRIAGAIITICILFAFPSCDGNPRSNEVRRDAETTTRRYERIVSLSPSITETLFALGLDDRVAGVTRFCTYPPEAAAKPSVGGYLDPNYEAMAMLEPDLVLLLPEQEEVRTYLDRLGIPHETLENRTVEDIMATIVSVGRICGVESRADSLVTAISVRMDAVRDRIRNGTPPRVLISVGRTTGTGTLRDVYVAGPGTSYDELIMLAGGLNAFDDNAVAYPMISAEGLLYLDPDIIVDLLPEFDGLEFDRDAVMDEWASAGTVRAVRNNAVHLITGDYAVVPGPRFILFLEELADIIRTDTGTP